MLRGDLDSITFGENSNFQDGCVAHTDPGFPVVVGSGVSVGHRAVLHGCTVEDDTLIGMGAVVLNGAVVGTGSLVAAGTVVLEGTVIPPNSLVAGVPGKVRRETTEDERAHIRANARALHRAARRARRRGPTGVLTRATFAGRKTDGPAATRRWRQVRFGACGAAQLSLVTTTFCTLSVTGLFVALLDR